MISLDFDILQVRSSAAPMAIEAAAVAGDASAAEIQSPVRGVASDPLTEWLAGAEEAEVSNSELRFAVPDLEWTAEHERTFALLAGREAVGTLNEREEVELDRLARLRRGMRNPRPGEELVQEYEQRELTRDLIKALDRYVRFHKAAHFTESAEA